MKVVNRANNNSHKKLKVKWYMYCIGVENTHIKALILAFAFHVVPQL